VVAAEDPDGKAEEEHDGGDPEGALAVPSTAQPVPHDQDSRHREREQQEDRVEGGRHGTVRLLLDQGRIPVGVPGNHQLEEDWPATVGRRLHADRISTEVFQHTGPSGAGVGEHRRIARRLGRLETRRLQTGLVEELRPIGEPCGHRWWLGFLGQGQKPYQMATEVGHHPHVTGRHRRIDVGDTPVPFQRHQMTRSLPIEELARQRPRVAQCLPAVGRLVAGVDVTCVEQVRNDDEARRVRGCGFVAQPRQHLPRIVFERVGAARPGHPAQDGGAIRQGHEHDEHRQRRGERPHGRCWCQAFFWTRRRHQLRSRRFSGGKRCRDRIASGQPRHHRPH
jgi:hypothetical protein